MDFVGAVADELVVGEFVLCRLVPGSQTSEYLIGLGLRVDVFSLRLLLFVLAFAVLSHGCILSYFFLLIFLLFLLFFLGSISSSLFLSLLFLVL